MASIIITGDPTRGMPSGAGPSHFGAPKSGIQTCIYVHSYTYIYMYICTTILQGIECGICEECIGVVSKIIFYLLQDQGGFVYVCSYLCMYVYARICKHRRVYVDLCIHVLAYASTFMHVEILIYTCMHAYVFIYTYMYVCIVYLISFVGEVPGLLWI